MINVEIDREHELAVVQAGAGRDIVLVHGSFATHQDWLSGPFAALARHGRVTALDRPGHGNSRRPRLSASPGAQAAQIAAGLRLLGIERPIMVGHSFGALVALAYARDHPVAGLVLLSPAAFPEFRPLEHTVFAPRAAPLAGPLWAWGMSATLDRPLLEGMHRLMFAPGEPPETWRASYPWDQILCPAGTVANGEDLLTLHPMLASAPDWSMVDAPAIVISSGADLVFDDRLQAMPLVHALQNARHVRVAGAGHMIHHNRPDAVEAALCDLLEVGRVEFR